MSAADLEQARDELAARLRELLRTVPRYTAHDREPRWKRNQRLKREALIARAEQALERYAPIPKTAD
jgi:hypothetical protein